MPRRKKRSEHTGRTAKGHTRDLKVERLGKVTIYRRGTTYYLYHREDGRTERRRIEGNLAVARATAAKIAAALEENRPSPLGFQRTTPGDLVDGYLDYIENVQRLAWRTQDRYRAALERLLEFSAAAELTSIDTFDEVTIEDFVRWLRGQTRTRNGATNGKRKQYDVGGIRFILCTCRTAFNWAARRRMLPAHGDNPFSRFPTDRLRDLHEEDQRARVLTVDEERRFFQACSPWQRGIFATLGNYGMRVGELTHLLVEDVDFRAGVVYITSKPALYWRVKTSRRRQLPLTAVMRDLFRERINGRRAGFVFLNEDYFTGDRKPAAHFASPDAFRKHLQQVARQVSAGNPEASEREKWRAVAACCRRMGQMPEKRVRTEFMKLTEAIGCPEFTRAHDLRHLFSSRAQERGVNPLLVQELLGHTTLDMTRRYTHLSMDAKRQAIEQLHQLDAVEDDEQQQNS